MKIDISRCMPNDRDFAMLCSLLDAHLTATAEDKTLQRQYDTYNTSANLDTAFVAYVDGKPVGCVAFKRIGDDMGEVKRMFVMDEYRGNGLGARLLDTLEKAAMAEGVTSLVLESARRLENAHALYRKAGYRNIPNFGQYKDMPDSICMGKALASITPSNTWPNISVRHEQPDDYRMVEEITREAFWNLYCPGAHEHYMVHTFRNHPDFMPELSFVIELAGRLVGSIFYTRAKVIRENGANMDIVSFGPVSIHPDLHRKGLGRALILHSIQAAKDSGHRAIIIGGFRYHYEPYGFVGAKKYGIAMPDGKYYTGIMALPLFDGALDDARGQVHFSAALYPDMSDLDAYDATFAKKEKRVLPCQEEFARAATEIDTRESF